MAVQHGGSNIYSGAKTELYQQGRPVCHGCQVCGDLEKLYGYGGVYVCKNCKKSLSNNKAMYKVDAPPSDCTKHVGVPDLRCGDCRKAKYYIVYHINLALTEKIDWSKITTPAQPLHQVEVEEEEEQILQEPNDQEQYQEQVEEEEEILEEPNDREQIMQLDESSYQQPINEDIYNEKIAEIKKEMEVLKGTHAREIFELKQKITEYTRTIAELQTKIDVLNDNAEKANDLKVIKDRKIAELEHTIKGLKETIANATNATKEANLRAAIILEKRDLMAKNEELKRRNTMLVAETAKKDKTNAKIFAELKQQILEHERHIVSSQEQVSELQTIATTPEHEAQPPVAKEPKARQPPT